MCGGLWERSCWFQSISWLMDRCLQCSQQSPQLAPQSISDRPRTVKCSGSKMQCSKTAATQPYLNQLPHKSGACEETHFYLWKYIPAITNPHGQSLPDFQSESVARHLPATTTCSPDVDFPHGGPQNAHPSLPLFGDDTSLGHDLNTCLTRRTQYPSLSQDSRCSPPCIANSNYCPMQQRKHSSFYQHLNLWSWGGMMRGLRMLPSSAAWTWLCTTAYTFQNEMQLFSSCCTIHINNLFSLGPHSSQHNHPQNRVKHLENPETNTSMDLQSYSSVKINKIYLNILSFEQLEQKFLSSVNVLRVHWALYVIDADINSSGSNTDPWGAPLMTGFHLNIELLTSWMWPQN